HVEKFRHIGTYWAASTENQHRNRGKYTCEKVCVKQGLIKPIFAEWREGLPMVRKKSARVRANFIPADPENGPEQPESQNIVRNLSRRDFARSPQAISRYSSAHAQVRGRRSSRMRKK